jgi:hypothetical protein
MARLGARPCTAAVEKKELTMKALVYHGPGQKA